jgi:hypothetical protein
MVAVAMPNRTPPTGGALSDVISVPSESGSAASEQQNQNINRAATISVLPQES